MHLLNRTPLKIVKKYLFRPFPLFLVTIFLLWAIGYGIGRLGGNSMLESLILRKSRFPLLVARPVDQMFNVYNLINSGNPDMRISGYYSLLENNMIDEQFLIERYQQEKPVYIKRTIIWILGYARDRKKVLKFFSGQYDTGTRNIKREILKSMYRVDPKFCWSFISRKKIKKELTKDLDPDKGIIRIPWIAGSASIQL